MLAPGAGIWAQRAESARGADATELASENEESNQWINPKPKPPSFAAAW